eukprot:c7135_g1_i1.p1 GENE.c7135_g1_i1~~c7135_g1_i1.p1  ORF type:complete len:478 (+),score=126.39 c7135_g1_i1:353-1786(+)
MMFPRTAETSKSRLETPSSSSIVPGLTTGLLAHRGAYTQNLASAPNARPQQAPRRVSASDRAQQRTASNLNRLVPPNFPVDLSDRPVSVIIAGAGAGNLVLAHLLLMAGVDVQVFASPSDQIVHQSVHMDKRSLQIIRLVGPKLYSKIKNKLRLSPAHNGGFRDGYSGEWLVQFDNLVDPEDNPEFSPATYASISSRHLQRALLKSIPRGVLQMTPIEGFVVVQSNKVGDESLVVVRTSDGSIHEANILIGAKSEWKSNLFAPSKYSGNMIVSGTCHKSQLPLELSPQRKNNNNLQGIYLGDSSFVTIVDSDPDHFEWRAVVPAPLEHAITTPAATTLRKLKSKDSPFADWTREVIGVIRATTPSNVEQRPMYETAQPGAGEILLDGPILLVDETNPSQAISEAYEIFTQFVNLNTDYDDNEEGSGGFETLRYAIHDMLQDQPVLTQHNIPMSALDLEVLDFFLRAGVFDDTDNMKL